MTTSQIHSLDLESRHLFGVGLALLIVLGFMLRLAPVGRYVTPDEPAWVERSIRFRDALATHDWASVPSTGHPGVTTMWLGAAGVTVRQWLNPVESADHLAWIRRLAWLAPENGEAFRHLAFFLPYGRVAVALTNSLGLVASFWLLRRLLEPGVALLAVGLLALDSFLVGHGGLLHTDGLLATFSTLSVLSLLIALRDETRAATRSGAWALASGVFGALALLTKSLAGYLVLFTGVVLGSAWALRRIWLRQAIEYALLWGLAGAALYVALYPAMWANPLDTVRDLVTAPMHESTRALMPTFFAGEMALRHGPEFYLVALPLRLSPIVLLGSLLSLWAFVRKEDLRPNLAWLGVFCVGYLLLLALNVKRYQRYLLPTIGPLTVMAAIAWSALWRSQRGSRGAQRLGRRSLLPLASVLCLIQLLLLLPFAAHPLTSFNALLGGPWVGSRLLSADWGEGMGAAARWLNRRPDAGQLTIAASSVPSFASLFDGHTVPVEQATRADYIVRSTVQTSAPSFQHPLAHISKVGFLEHAVILTNTAPLEQAYHLSAHADRDDLILLATDTPLLRRYDGPGTIHAMAHFPDETAIADWLNHQITDLPRSRDVSIWLVSSSGENELDASAITAAHVRRQLEVIGSPLHSTSVAGAVITEYVGRSSSMPNPPSSHRAVFGGQLALVDGVLPETVSWPDDLKVVLRWRAVAQSSSDHRAVVMLRDGDGHVWSQTERPVINSVFFPTSAWQVGEWADATYALHLPPTTPPGRYAVEVSLYRGDTGARLGATGPDGDFRGTLVPMGEVNVLQPEVSPDVGALDLSERLSVPPNVSVGGLTLLGIEHPGVQVLSGDSVSFALLWEADAVPEIDYRVAFCLVTPEGDIEVERTRPLSPYPTSRWQAGHRFQSRYSLRIPPDLPSGRYRLMLDVLDSRDQALLGDKAPLGWIEVLPRERMSELPDDVQHRVTLRFGESILLRGYEIARTEIQPGEALPLTLYWQAQGPTDRGYTLFVHLLGPDGRLQGQVDAVPGQGKAPTTSWAPGQVIVEHLSLSVAPDAPEGVYQVVVGFYDAAYGDRLPVQDASGRSLAEDRATLPVDIKVLGGSQ